LEITKYQQTEKSRSSFYHFQTAKLNLSFQKTTHQPDASHQRQIHATNKTTPAKTDEQNRTLTKFV
jgi:hypothetical protein